jgi:IS605 OrfB family transposase
MIQNYGTIDTEKLDIESMIENNVKGNQNKEVKNKSILDGGWYTLISMMKYKAEEAGTSFIEVNTLEVKPSQRCPQCWKINPEMKDVNIKVHHCKHCGFKEDRDVSAAMTMLKSHTNNRLGTNLQKSVSFNIPLTTSGSPSL